MTGIWPDLGLGVGFRKEHVHDLVGGHEKVAWLEIITENHLNSKGLPQKNLQRLRENYPIVCHGVSLSIASSDPLDKNYLKQLREFIRQIEPALVSDHLCWTGVDHENMHQLLPLPRTEETLKHIVSRIKQAQDVINHQILFENISTYLDFSSSEFPEWEFLRTIAQESDSGILLDINNVYVNSQNHGYDPQEFICEMPLERVGQFHLGGHEDMGTHLFDAHNAKVCDEVWDLFELSLNRFGGVSTLFEWDMDIPDFSVMESELKRAEEIQKKVLRAS